MTPTQRWADIIKLMKSHGWEACDGPSNSVVFTRPGGHGALLMDEGLAAVFDARYQQGFADGFGRGAYEAETKEDVEPAAPALDRGALLAALLEGRMIREYSHSINYGSMTEEITVVSYLDPSIKMT